jgi:hypothetical protein
MAGNGEGNGNGRLANGRFATGNRYSLVQNGKKTV